MVDEVSWLLRSQILESMVQPILVEQHEAVHCPNPCNLLLTLSIFSIRCGIYSEVLGTLEKAACGQY